MKILKFIGAVVDWFCPPEKRRVYFYETVILTWLYPILAGLFICHFELMGYLGELGEFLGMGDSLTLDDIIFLLIFLLSLFLPIWSLIIGIRIKKNEPSKLAWPNFLLYINAIFGFLYNALFTGMLGMAIR